MNRGEAPEEKKTAGLLCAGCGLRWVPSWLVCESCGGVETAERGTALQVSSLPPPAASVLLPHPWGALGRWPAGAPCLISGGPGAGKSTAAAALCGVWPGGDLWVTTEQTTALATAHLLRCAPKGAAPPVVEADGLSGAVEAIESADPGGLVVLDSLTAAGSWEDQRLAAVDLVKWAHVRGARLLLVQQVNAQGEGAGQMALPHLVESVVRCEGSTGLRVFNVRKNRHGPAGQRLYLLGARGVEAPALGGAAYSVEGKAGNYRLHPYPLPGAKWAGLLGIIAGLKRAPDGERVSLEGMASAAIPCAAYSSGLLFPLDVSERRRFAEDQGLRWIDAIPEL